MTEPVTTWVRVTGHLPGVHPGDYVEVDLTKPYVQDAISSGFMVPVGATDVGSESDDDVSDRHPADDDPVELIPMGPGPE